MAKKPSKQRLLEEYLAEKKPAVIDEAWLEEIGERLAPISSTYLRKLVRATSLPLAPLVEGVRQESLDALERTLIALEREYNRAAMARDTRRARRIRAEVIEAKDHAQWALRRTAETERRTAKEEMIAWMLVWLENPRVFPQWVKLRKAATQPGPTAGS